MNRPFRIALMRTGGHGWMGGAEYLRNLILALGGLPVAERRDFELTLITDEELSGELQRQLESCLGRIYRTWVDLPRPTLANKVRWKILRTFLNFENPRFYDFFKREQFDFIYPFFSYESELKHFKCAMWMPDFQHKYLRAYFSQTELARRDEIFEHQIRLFKTLVLSSEAAASDFRKFYPGADISTKVLRFRTCPDPEWFTSNPVEVQQKYNLPDRFFLVSNQFWQHKNHLAILDALSLLKEKGDAPIIVCTGHIYDYRRPGFSDEILQKIHLLGLSNHVMLLGLVPKLDQIQLMRRSIAVIQPSLFEGWSTVVEDARVMGKIMILSDFVVHLEQDPPGARFFQKESPEDLSRIMEECWRSLPAGPDLEREATAREKNGEERNRFARTFLKIAKAG